ncbi:MAG: type VI secretion system tip protein VgrG [Pseudomonadota bacterium]
MPIQENRLISIETPLGQDALLLSEFSGTESISRLFNYRLTLLSENHRIPFADIIGKNVTLSIDLAGGEKRFINGLIASFSQSGSGTVKLEAGYFSQYSATLVPWPWLLAKTADMRIFQERPVPEIIQQVFTDNGFSDFSLRLHGPHNKRVYCVQYRETDFNFVSRLMEEEGIYYFFEHESGKHTMVLADSSSEHPVCPKQETARYQQTEGGVILDEDVIHSLEVQQEIRVGKFSLNDYNFETPSANLLANAVSTIELGPGEREIYDYPAEFANRSEGDILANILMQGEEAQITSLSGSSNCRAFCTGYRFDLKDYFREDMSDKPYVLTEISHMAASNIKDSGSEGGAFYSNSFSCIPHEIPFRPQQLTPKPIVEGVQTATVVGTDSDKEIHTNEYGQVKVRFHWDREKNSSCWIRVSQAWAGSGWGGMIIPRVGQEVIVDFLEGDPDRPIITGRVYNATQTVPYALPGEKTKSTLKSYSSPGGGGFNEIRFEDKKGSEQLFIHAEKQLDNRVKQDCLEWIGNERHLIVIKDQFEKVSGDNHMEVVGDQNQKIGGSVSLTTGEALHQKVGTLHALDAGQEIHLKAGMKVIIEAGLQISLKVGGNFIDIGPTGISITGTPAVKINSGGSAGSGSGASPDAPTAPKEADKAEPGKMVQATGASSTKAPPPPPAPPGKQAASLKEAAKNAAALCEA